MEHHIAKEIRDSDTLPPGCRNGDLICQCSELIEAGRAERLANDTDHRSPVSQVERQVALSQLLIADDAGLTKRQQRQAVIIIENRGFPTEDSRTGIIICTVAWRREG